MERVRDVAGLAPRISRPAGASLGVAAFPRPRADGGDGPKLVVARQGRRALTPASPRNERSGRGRRGRTRGLGDRVIAAPKEFVARCVKPLNRCRAVPHKCRPSSARAAVFIGTCWPRWRGGGGGRAGGRQPRRHWLRRWGCQAHRSRGVERAVARLFFAADIITVRHRRACRSWRIEAFSEPEVQVLSGPPIRRSTM